MSDHARTAALPMPLTARPATCSDRAAMERLWLLFRHDMSAVNGDLPRADGSYRSERLEHALSGTPGWLGWILTAADHPLGLAVVRASDQPVRVINSFFVVAAARRCGTGSAFARAVVSSHPGRWAVAHQDRNRAAARFWPAVAATLDRDWTSAHKPVPGRPDAPPDRWITFTAPEFVDVRGRPQADLSTRAQGWSADNLDARVQMLDVYTRRSWS